MMGFPASSLYFITFSTCCGFGGITPPLAERNMQSDTQPLRRFWPRLSEPHTVHAHTPFYCWKNVGVLIKCLFFSSLKIKKNNPDTVDMKCPYYITAQIVATRNKKYELENYGKGVLFFSSRKRET